MDWNQLSDKKEEWQRKTFRKIKNSLFKAKDESWDYDNSEEKHLVMIYGKSQVGKTTLILNLIGIKEEYFQEVYNALRADIPRGNSSTSTSIVYSKSSNERYGLAISSFDVVDEKEYYYFSDVESFKMELKRIRERIESKKASTNEILFINIPDFYFLEDPSINQISIIDMPGVESRNHKEDEHVRGLMTKYIPISSVCIIACVSNEIESLNTIELPIKVDWKKMDHRFIVVVTKSFNDGLTKEYFAKKRKDRKENFSEFVRKAYEQEIYKKLGTDKISIFPIDIGDTFTCLCNSLKDTEDVDELESVRDEMLTDLRNTIVSRKGERLKAALADLKSIVNSNAEYEKNELQKENEELKNKEKELERRKENNDKKRSLYKDNFEIDEYNNKLSQLTKLNNNLKCHNYTNKIALWDNVCDYCEKEKLWQIQIFKDDRYISKLKFENKVIPMIVESIQNIISNPIDEYNKKNESIIKTCEIEPDDNRKNDMIKKVKEFVLNHEEDAYHRKIVIRVYGYNIRNLCDNIQEFISKEFKEYKRDYISFISSEIEECKKQINEYNSQIAKFNTISKNIKKDIDDCRNNISDNEMKKKSLKKKMAMDQRNIDNYRLYAEQAYYEEREAIISRINNSPKSDNKIVDLLLLGLVDKDYYGFVRGGAFYEK